MKLTEPLEILCNICNSLDEIAVMVGLTWTEGAGYQADPRYTVSSYQRRSRERLVKKLRSIGEEPLGEEGWTANDFADFFEEELAFQAWAEEARTLLFRLLPSMHERRLTEEASLQPIALAVFHKAKELAPTDEQMAAYVREWEPLLRAEQKGRRRRR